MESDDVIIPTGQWAHMVQTDGQTDRQTLISNQIQMLCVDRKAGSGRVQRTRLRSTAQLSVDTFKSTVCA